MGGRVFRPMIQENLLGFTPSSALEELGLRVRETARSREEVDIVDGGRESGRAV